MKILKLWFCKFGLILALAIAANAASLKFTYTLENIPGAQQTNPYAINNAGVIVGTYVDGNLNTHGYVMDGKRLVNLDAPGAMTGTTCPCGLNPDGPVSIVGWYSTKSGRLVGFLYKNGAYTVINGPSGALASAARGINDTGDIVGVYLGADGAGHGFILKNGTYTSLDVPGALSTTANAINTSGEIVLNWLDSNGNYNASLYDGTTYKTIDVPNAVSSEATGINAAGDVCYEWSDAIGVYHGSLLHDGKYVDFDVPTHGGTWAYGINDIGNIVGNGIYHSIIFGFKATYGL